MYIIHIGGTGPCQDILLDFEGDYFILKFINQLFFTMVPVWFSGTK
jgi:hypothetical protein